MTPEAQTVEVLMPHWPQARLNAAELCHTNPSIYINIDIYIGIDGKEHGNYYDIGVILG